MFQALQGKSFSVTNCLCHSVMKHVQTNGVQATGVQATGMRATGMRENQSVRIEIFGRVTSRVSPLIAGVGAVSVINLAIFKS